MTLTTKHLTLIVVAALIFSAVSGGCRKLPIPVKSSKDNSGQSYVLASPQPTTGFALDLLPTPSSAGVATVGGRLMRDIGDHSEPMAGIKILLASVLRSKDGTPVVARASEETSPAAVTSENGVFIFTDVPPDTYGIAVVTPLGMFLIQDETGKDFLFAVQGGTVLDLGEIHTTLPY